MRIAILCGGHSYERAVSLRSAGRIEEALRELGHDPVVVDVDDTTGTALTGRSVDCAFVALHGRSGRDGSIQELLELMGIPYTGSRARESALVADKIATKQLLATTGIATPPFVTIDAESLRQLGATDALHDIGETIGFPLVAKPAHGGSALGVRFAREAKEVPSALMTALSYDTQALLERAVIGREIAIAILGTRSPRALPAVGIAPRNSSWFDFEARYSFGETEFTVPASTLDEEESQMAAEAAIAAYQAAGLTGYGRVDMIVDDAGIPWILELDAVPGMTDTSLVPIACAAGGISFEHLISLLIEAALTRGTRTELSKD